MSLFRDVIASVAWGVAASALTGCAAPAGGPIDDSARVVSADLRQSIHLTDDVSSWPADAVAIQSASITGDTLVITLSHGGGCRDHRYALIAERAWRETSPVSVGVRLAHDAAGDPCKALLTRELRVGLAPLRDAFVSLYGVGDRRIALSLSGAPGGSWIVYSF